MKEISPELALVDPELAAEARRSLPEPPPAVPAERPVHGTRRRTRRRRSVAVAALIAILALAAAGLGVVLTARGDDDSRAQPSLAPTTGVLGATRTAVPRRSLPAAGRPGRVYTWAEAEGAVFYEVTFVRNGRVFHAAQTAEPWLRVPDTLKFAPGTYRWSVRPAIADDSGIVVGDAVVVRTFRVGGG